MSRRGLRWPAARRSYLMRSVAPTYPSLRPTVRSARRQPPRARAHQTAIRSPNEPAASPCVPPSLCRCTRVDGRAFGGGGTSLIGTIATLILLDRRARTVDLPAIARGSSNAVHTRKLPSTWLTVIMSETRVPARSPAPAHRHTCSTVSMFARHRLTVLLSLSATRSLTVRFRQQMRTDAIPTTWRVDCSPPTDRALRRCSTRAHRAIACWPTLAP